MKFETVMRWAERLVVVWWWKQSRSISWLSVWMYEYKYCPYVMRDLREENNDRSQEEPKHELYYLPHCINSKVLGPTYPTVKMNSSGKVDKTCFQQSKPPNISFCVPINTRHCKLPRQPSTLNPSDGSNYLCRSTTLDWPNASPMFHLCSNANISGFSLP